MNNDCSEFSGSQAERPPIHTLWVDGELGPLEWACVQSWRALGYPVTLHSYETPEVLEGVELFDAKDLMPQDEIFRSPRNNSLALFGDVYRAKILQNFDAVWMDTDIFLTRPLPFEGRNVLAYEIKDELEGVNNAIMKLERDHPILEEIVGRYERPFQRIFLADPRKNMSFARKSLLRGSFHAKNSRWGTLGKYAIHHILEKQGFEGQILSSTLGAYIHQSLIFTPQEDTDQYLAAPRSYFHMHKSRIKYDLANPLEGSLYHRLVTGNFA